MVEQKWRVPLKILAINHKDKDTVINEYDYLYFNII